MKKKNIDNILFIIGGSYIYGAEKISLSIIESIIIKYKIHCVINGWNNGEFKLILKKNKIDFSEIKLGWIYIRKPFWTIDTLINLPFGYWKYYKLLKKIKPSVIYHTSYRSIFQLYPFLNSNNIFHVHDKLSKTLGQKILRIVDKKIVFYIAVSDYIREDLINCGINENKIKVIYNGINFTFSGLPIYPYLNDGIFRIGIVGQIAERKGHEVLLEALSNEKLLNRNFVLNIYGTGDDAYIHKLKTKISELRLQDSVIFHGFIKDKEEIYNAIDFCVIPSILPESFGLVAVEPAIYSKPVIASSIGGLSEIVQHNKTGLLFKNSNVENLVEQLLLLMNNPVLIQKLGTVAREIYHENYSEEKMREEVAERIKEVSDLFLSKNSELHNLY